MDAIQRLTFKMRRRIAITAIVIGGFITTLGAIIWGANMFLALFDEPPHPSSQELIDNFYTHQAEFEQLRQMFLADEGLSRVADDFTRPENPEVMGITPARLDEYRRLFHQLNLKAGIEGDKESIRFIASTRGLSVSGSAKGYVYTRVPPELMVDNLDTYRSEDGRSFTAYQHLEGNWYLYYDYED